MSTTLLPQIDEAEQNHMLADDDAALVIDGEGGVSVYLPQRESMLNSDMFLLAISMKARDDDFVNEQLAFATGMLDGLQGMLAEEDAARADEDMDEDGDETFGSDEDDAEEQALKDELALLSELPIGSTWLHLKRGGQYVVLSCLPDENGKPEVGYMALDGSGTFWRRRLGEFMDGRFKLLEGAKTRTMESLGIALA